MLRLSRAARKAALMSLPLVILSACAASGDRQGADAAISAAVSGASENAPGLPTGSRAEASGFVSIDSAPPTEFPDDPPPAEPREEGLVEKFARENGYTLQEAMGRINGNEELQNEIQRLGTVLRSKEAGNYVDMRMVRNPAVTMLVTFKRDAAATLRKYSSNPDFRAVEGGRTPGELQPIADRWIKRLNDSELQYGLGSQPDLGQIEMNLGITKQEFEALVRKNGWIVEPEIVVTYANAQPPAFADPSLAQLVRVFPRAGQAPILVLSSLTTGTVTLNDGCFRMADEGSGRGDRLVLFGRDVQLTRDSKGYLAITTGQKPLGRIGELMGWGGYGPANEKEPDVIALRKACGNAEIVSIGSPESMRLFSTPYQAQIEEYARKNKLGRQAAWREITSCLTKNGDARFARGGAVLPEKDCYGMPTTPPPPVENPEDCPEGTTHSYGLCRDENGDSVPALR